MAVKLLYGESTNSASRGGLTTASTAPTRISMMRWTGAAPMFRCPAVQSDGTSGGCTSRRCMTDSLAMVLRKRYWYYKFPARVVQDGGGIYGSHEGRRAGGGRLVYAAGLLVRAPEDRQGGGEGPPHRTGQDRGASPAAAAGHREDGRRRGGRALGARRAEAARQPPGGHARRLPVLN